MYEHELSFAHGLADRAGDIGMGLFLGDGLEVRHKADRTVVTQADTSIEAMVREQVAAAFPDDHVLGEEEGGTDREQGRVWIVDPIDATANFARGIPIWATLIALEESDAVRLGVVSAPALGRRWWAERGSGAYAGGEPARVSTISNVEDAVVSLPLENRVPALARRAWHARGLGDFWAHMLVAEGAVDGAVDATRLREWDLAAVQVIVEEAGGRFSDRTGRARIDSGTAVTSNGLVHEELLAAMAEQAQT